MKKSYFRKTMTLLTTAVLTGSVLAGCGSDPGTSESTGGSTPEESRSTSQAPEEKKEPSESADQPETGEAVDLVWYTVGNGMPDNYDAWKANLDAYLEEKIGVHLDVQVVSWSDWDKRRSTVVSTNEPYDIMFTNLGTYNNDVSIGAFADITELVKTASPQLYQFIPEDYWNAAAIGGKIYGVPSYKDSSSTQYFVWDQELADQYGIDYHNIHTLADAGEALQKLMDGENITPFILNNQGLDAIYGSRYDNIGTGLPAVGVSYDDASRTVVPVFEQQDILDELKVIREWYQAGIINKDAATLTENPNYRACFIAQGWPYAAKSTWGPNMGVEAVAVQYGETVLSNDTVLGSINCISASSAHPDKALELLQLVNTDSYVRDALRFGLEGDNFTYTDDGRVHIDQDKNWPMAGYTQGTFFNISLTDEEDYNQWEEVRALNEQAKPSPVLGFSFHMDQVRDQISSCNEIWLRYRPELMTGTVDPESTIKEMMKEMRAAGFDDIVAEAQEQINKAF